MIKGNNLRQGDGEAVMLIRTRLDGRQDLEGTTSVMAVQKERSSLRMGSFLERMAQKWASVREMQKRKEMNSSWFK